MFHVIDVSFLIIFGFNFCWCFDEVWRSYQLHSKIYNPEGKSFLLTYFK